MIATYIAADGVSHEIVMDAFHYLCNHDCFVLVGDQWQLNPHHLWTHDEVQCLLTEVVPS